MNCPHCGGWIDVGTAVLSKLISLLLKLLAVALFVGCVGLLLLAISCATAPSPGPEPMPVPRTLYTDAPALSRAMANEITASGYHVDVRAFGLFGLAVMERVSTAGPEYVIAAAVVEQGALATRDMGGMTVMVLGLGATVYGAMNIEPATGTVTVRTLKLQGGTK